MALEIMDLLYLADEPQNLISNPRWSKVVKTSPKVLRTPSKVVHNFQHDLEPLWWILLWVITKLVDHRPSQLYGDTIFTHSMHASIERRAALVKPLELEFVLKDSLSTFAEDMEEIRKALFVHYKHRDEPAKLNNPCSYTNIHDTFQQFFDMFVDDKDSSWASEPLIQSKGSTEAHGATTDDGAVSTDEAKISESERKLDEPEPLLSAPQRHIRPTPPGRDPITTGLNGNLLQSQSLMHDDDESGRRFSKRLKSRK